MLKFYFVVFLSQLGDKPSATPKRLSLSKHMFYSCFNVCKTCTIWINAIPRRKLKGKEELPSERTSIEMVYAKSTTMCKKSLKIHDTRKCVLLVMSVLFEKKTSHEGTTQHREIKPFQKLSKNFWNTFLRTYWRW